MEVVFRKCRAVSNDIANNVYFVQECLHLFRLQFWNSPSTGCNIRWMVSYSTLDGKLQNTGWVKNSGTAAGRCRNIYGGKDKYYQYQ
jgi:hypothetical protein